MRETIDKAEAVVDGAGPWNNATSPPVEVFTAVNLSLAEYDLPAHMSDASVLAELFSLLDLPRDAVTFPVERLLLAAISHHRDERRALSDTRLAEVGAKLRAAALNDTASVDAHGASRVRLEDVWSVAASNETVHTLLIEALQLMEASVDAADDDVWARLLEHAEMSTADAAASVRLPDAYTAVPDAAAADTTAADAAADTSVSESAGGPTVLHTAFVSVRARRASEARVQSAFEELIAAVRAEDPSLAADEARKAVTTGRYEAARIRLLTTLLGRAASGGVVGAAEVLTAHEQRVATDGGGIVVDDSPVDAAADEPNFSNGDPDVELSPEAVVAWANELATLQSRRAASARAEVGSGAEEAKETAKHEHYARLLKLPRLIDETLSSWIDPSEDLSDKQIFHELLRMMGLVDTVEPRLMRAMIEAVKQHRLRREREEIEKGDWADSGPESLTLRSKARLAHPTSVRKASAMVNHAGDGSDFAIFVATLLHAIGAHVRVSLGCSRNVTIPPAAPDGPPWVVAAHQARVAAEPWRGEAVQVCQTFAEVRLGRNPQKISTWVRTWLPGSRWLGKQYHYRLDRDGYAWLNLDWIDGASVQRPGAPFKPFETATIYYPHELRWETEGDVLDSLGQPKLKDAPIEALKMGVR